MRHRQWRLRAVGAWSSDASPPARPLNWKGLGPILAQRPGQGPRRWLVTAPPGPYSHLLPDLLADLLADLALDPPFGPTPIAPASAVGPLGPWSTRRKLLTPDLLAHQPPEVPGGRIPGGTGSRFGARCEIEGRGAQNRHGIHGRLALLRDQDPRTKGPSIVQDALFAALTHAALGRAQAIHHLLEDGHLPLRIPPTIV